MKKTTLLALLAGILFAPLSFSQSINNWQTKRESELPKSLKREITSTKYQVFHLDINEFRENLQNAVVRDENNHLSHTVLLSFPFEDGRTEIFSVEKVNVLAPELGVKYPQIQSFRGVSIDNPLNVIHFSMYNNEFRGLITGARTIYIDPYAKNEFENYIVYDRSDFVRSPDEVMICNAIDQKLDESDLTPSTHRNSTDAKYRTYDLAVACTSEYSAYYGNVLANVLAAVNTTITRVNSVYEKDLAVHFQLVAGEDRLIYINNVNKDTTPDADPYDNYDGSQMLSANTANITGLLGVNNYDIGHVFSTGGGGIASTAPCNASGKGQGVTGIVTPQYDPFDIDYVCHEMGHQFGAGHTQNNTCQYSATSGLEPGSASTIMGYAGICPPNVQNNSDAYFHAISIQQITTQISGHTCETETTISNNEPVITAIGNFTIPISTPFILTANATDSAADLLTMTYCWEEMDATTTGLAQTPQATNTTRPQFRSFFPTTSPSRTFPNLNAVISNTTPTWEVLPSVARTMKFRCTVRDNNPLGGQTNQDNTTITVGSAGPFSVTSPNTATTWYVGESKTITWNVNSTNTATYSVNVNIKMSTDGGLTYPITLLSATPNDGTQAITVPSNIGTTNRIKVEAAANVFFDISNADFEIKSNKFDLTTTQAIVSVCKPTSAVYTLNYTPAPGFTETTTFSATNLPSGASVAFSPTTRNASGTVTMTVSGMSGVAIGNYSINAIGTSTTANISLPLTLKVFDSNIGTISLSSPINGATNQATSVSLQWGALSNASSYEIQVAANPNFSIILESATVTTNSYQTASLTTGSINYWRVRPVNTCITGAYSEIYVFQIASDYCHTYTNEYYDGNNIWEENSTNAVIAKMDVPDNVVISKVSFYMRAQHESLADIKMQFSGPTGIFAEIYNRDCSGTNFDITFDDAGVVLTCGNIDPLTTAGMEGIQQASQPLSKFNGTSSLGTWTLLATDRGSNTSGGTFNDLNVIICGKLQIVNNISLTNNILNVTQGTTAALTSTSLSASQPSATNTNLVFTLTQLPTKGLLKKSGTNLAVGDTFTQADINNGIITYVHNGVNNSADNFKFSVTGLNLALLGAQTFNFNICNVTNTPSQVNVLCFGNATGSATVAPTGGTAPYTYSWSPSGGTAVTASNLVAGNYTCTITDATGCSINQGFTITQPTAAISNTVSQVNVLCFGNATGSATVVASGGTGAYAYAWTPSGGTAATASNLVAGNYSVRITDANGCFKDQAFTITQPTAAISNTVSQVNILCFGNNTGSASVVASGGTGAYTYAWTPTGGTAATASNLLAGNYSVRITDANGCFKDQAFTITQPTAAISNTVSQVNILCFGNNTGSASVVASGGTGAYTYAWTPSGGTAATASNLTAGNYSVRITDANGCFKDQAFTITQPTAAISNTVSQVNILCFGNNTGSASVVASGGTGAYTYAWTPTGGTAATASNLLAGNYSVRITDANGCFKDQAFTITQPTAAISNTISQVNVLCFGNATGSATVVASGGTGAYAYAWTPSGGTGATASNLTAGNYSVRITDANGCFKDQAFTITQPTAAISNTVSQVNILCFGNNTGSATVVASGGTGAYTYAWTPTGGTAATASNLVAGNYSVRITDANGCFKDQAFTITQPTAAISNTVSQVNVLCFGNATGSATVVASGGTGAYSYAWTPSGGTAATASNLVSGNYSVRITDANGCFKDQAFTITQPTAAISNTVSQTNILCFGAATGSATVVASGGTGAYSYLWSPSGGTAATASNLVSGNYSVRITDTNGCFRDQAFTITQPTAAISNTVSQTNILCFGAATGSATVVASGGTGAYAYAWTPSGGTAATASNLTAGNYSVRITDANGCFKDQAFTITQPTAAISNTVSQVNVLCFGNATGSATVVASGGTGAYAYAWTPSGGTAATASNLVAGNYSVRITDANGCFKDQAFTITQPTAAISNTVSQVNVLCFGNATGSATVVASGGTGAYSYLWSPSGSTAATASNLVAGNYSVRITDANGCFKNQAFTITQPTAAISNTVSQTNILCFGAATGSASVVASGGTGAYAYAWTPSGGTGATASNLTAGNYSVRITDANGCFKDQAFTITQPTAAISNTVSQVNVLCFGNATGSATVVASGGTGAYAYAWTPSGGTAATASNLVAGNYSVRITDANGCFKDQAFTITQPTAAISNTVSQVNVLCFGAATGSATVVASGGTGAYTYLWSPSGGTAATASNLISGNYSVRITDANGCFKDQAFTITQPTAAISNTVSQTNILCFGAATGSATVVASGGTGAYAYAWTPSGGTGATASNLTAGNYSVRITDANGCFKDQAFTITQPTAAISNTVSQVNVLCFGNATGSATVVASGGTGAYSYAWTPSGGTAATASNLVAGNYSVRITDANGCFKDQAFAITQPTAAISNTVSQVNVLCFGNATGSATVVASGGTGAYSYLWSPSGGTAATASNLVAGNYSVRITDANGCFKDQAFTITQPTAAISNTVSQVNILCFGAATGSATVVASGGTGAYSYLWTPSGGTAATASNLVAGNYSVRITDANGCFKNQAFTITQPTAAISNTVSQVNVSCFSNANGSATVVASGGTGAYTYLWSPSGGTAATASNLVAGNYSVRITDANGCFKDQAFTITQPLVLSNTFSQTSVSCYGETDATASVVASGGTAPYSYSWSPSGGNAATATNLTPGNYVCTITDAHGCSKTQNLTIASPIITTWDGNSWSNGYPVAGVKAVINANYTSIGDLTACELEVNGIAAVTVLTGHDFVISGKVTVSLLSGLTFQNNANLIQVKDVANTGSIVSKRNAQMRRQDYVYWSSPVYPQNLLAFSPLTLPNRFYVLDEPTNSFASVNPVTNDFEVAKGFMIRAPNTFPNTVTTFNGQFTGVPNNGTKTTPLTVTNGKGYNLIGNPYPSPIDADDFLAINPGTLYFWTHTSQDAESGANYATYNTTGGVASIAGGATPNGFIQTGQGFVLARTVPGTATFTNAMRKGNNAGQFFRDGQVEKHRIWLNLNNETGPLNQMLVAYMTGATQAKDESIDGKLIENRSSISSIINDENFVIQGRSLPFEDTDVVPLSLHAETAGTYTLSIDHLDGLFTEGQNIFIKDNLAGITHNITQSAYSFVTTEGTFANRFEVVYQSAPLGTDNPVFTEDSIVIYKHDGILNVKTAIQSMSSIKIFDIRGRLIYEKADINSNTAQLNDLRAEKQVLLVQVTSENNTIITKKVVY